MTTENKSKPVSVTLKPDVLKRLDDLAKKWGTTRSGMIAILTNKEK